MVNWKKMFDVDGAVASILSNGDGMCFGLKEQEV